MIYLELFLAYMQIGLFSIGGGHAAIPVTQSVVVDAKGWMTMAEFTDMITISEMTPGPFAINSATYIGIKTAGILGGIVATLSFLIPSIVICSLLYIIFKRFRKVRAVDGLMQGIRPAVSGLISSAGFTILLTALFSAGSFAAMKTNFSFDPIALLIGAGAFVAVRKTSLNPVLVILLSGVAGLIIYGAAAMV